MGALILTTACSAPETPGREQSPIAGGTQDLSHQNVFLLVREGHSSAGMCTATLVAPNLLLTARHCVSPSEDEDYVQCGDSLLGEPYPASAFFATNDPMPNQNSRVFRAIGVRVPGLGVDTCGYDLALVILKSNVPVDVSTPAVPRIDRDVHPGEQYTAVGYGVNAAGNPNHSRMQRDGLSVECEPGTCGDGVESTEFLGETGICSGDSGGPALDTEGKVVGVVSRGGPNCSSPIYSTVTAWEDFIVTTAQEAAELGGYDPPFWVTTGSSDPPVVVDDGAGGAGGAPGETGATQGDVCDATSSCQDGFVCYAPSGSTEGTCTIECSSTAECPAGQECARAGQVSLCVAPTGGDESSGCALSTAPQAPPYVALGALALGTLAARRRRRR